MTAQGATHVALSQRLAEHAGARAGDMLTAGRATKVMSTTPATAQSAQNGEMRRPGIRAGEAGREALGICRVPVFPEDAYLVPAHARLTSSGAAAASSTSGGVSSGW